MVILNINLRRMICSRAKPVFRWHRLVLKASAFAMLLMSPALTLASNNPAAAPRLILQITVDALRGDLPRRYAHVLGEGGFRYLMEQGVDYTNAHYLHANTETIVGHVSLATGSVPAGHGMIGNVWFDRALGRLVYNIEDADYHLLSANSDIDQKTEIDPTQKAAKVDGRSPRAILSSTFSDELAAHYAGKAKIFGVSIKDRGAVSLAGHAGKAFWFSKASGEFVTSNYYYDAYPQWVIDWNAARLPQVYAGSSWELTHKPSTYLFGDADDREYETDFPGFGRTFPHAYGAADDKYFTTRLTLSPAGDELTLDFTKALLDAEQLGQDDIPDYLAVSFSSTDYVGHVFGASSLESEDNIARLDRFSSTDYVGHVFGASSLESEDNIARLDRTLADLFATIDKKVGLQNTLIVLSADHGQPEVPGYLHSLGNHSAHYINPAELDKAPAIAALKQKFGLGEELIEEFFFPYLYLNHELIRSEGLDQAMVEAAVVEELAKFNGVSSAVSSSALRESALPDTELMRKIRRNFHPRRSGDIYLVFDPNVFINDFDGLIVASTHGSPWRYDSYVPVMFAGAGLTAKTVSRAITPYDVAPTLANYLGIKQPSAAIGKPLAEVLGN